MIGLMRSGRFHHVVSVRLQGFHHMWPGSLHRSAAQHCCLIAALLYSAMSSGMITSKLFHLLYAWKLSVPFLLLWSKTDTKSNKWTSRVLTLTAFWRRRSIWSNQKVTTTELGVFVNFSKCFMAWTNQVVNGTTNWAPNSKISVIQDFIQILVPIYDTMETMPS